VGEPRRTPGDETCDAGRRHRSYAMIRRRPDLGNRRGVGVFAVWGLVALLWATEAVPPACAADDDASLAVAVKAAFLYKFQLYVHWPAGALGNPASAFNFCVVGAPAFGNMLDRVLQGQTIGSRQAVALRLATAPADSSCQVLYLATNDADFARQQLGVAAGRPVLTVTDGMTADGTRGMINFVLVDNHVRFEIDNAAAERSGLEFSSKLLHIAISVRQQPERTQ
jgi:hypothetical protein